MTEDKQHAQPHAPSDAGRALSAAGRETAEAYLKEQMRLAHLQAEELIREDAIRHWSLRVHHVGGVMKLVYETALAFIVVVLAIWLAVAVVAAARSDGLLIGAFEVPQDLAAKGLTGQFIANKLLDRLNEMQSKTNSARASSSFSHY